MFIKNCCAVLCICFLSLSGLLSCGLETIYTIDYIPQGVMQDTIRATITLPRATTVNGYDTYFDYFVIFYRIYISGVNPSGEILTPEDRGEINTTLNTDFNSFYPYTDITSTTVNTSGLDTTFYNRNYFMLTLEGAAINEVLSRNSLGGTLVIDFPFMTGERPTLTLNGTEYTLRRAVNSPRLNFTPQPDRYFLNHRDLYDITKATPEINADVATNTRTNQELIYTYVSMYIAASGTSLEMPPRTIFSQPTFIGIFRLAESG